MNDQFTDNHRDEQIARKLEQTAQQTHAHPQFAAELENRLKKMRPPKPPALLTKFQRISPTLRWVALMVLLGLALSWSIRTLIPAPQPGTESTPTPTIAVSSTPAPVEATPPPATQQSSYDFRGSKLFLQAPLPASPATAHIYVLDRDDIIRPATEEQARALAERFGIQGELYSAQGYIYGTDSYLISDGKRSLEVQSETYFSYVSDLATFRLPRKQLELPDASAIIERFLQERGFDFPFEVHLSSFFNAYLVRPLSPESIPMQYDAFAPSVMRVALGENGEVLSLDASLMSYDPAPLGEFEIISAEEALERLLDDAIITGKMESFNAPNNMPREWYRSYPDNQPVSVYGYLSSYPSVDPGKPSLLLLDGTPLTGNTSGLEGLETFTLVMANGQFLEENGIRKLNVESWDRNVNEVYLEGTLTRQGEQVVFVSKDDSGTQYPLIDPPADLPVDSVNPEGTLSVSGVIVDNMFAWTYIQYFENNMGGGGGGGGGGAGFHQLNLSGTPVPFTFPTAPGTPEQLMGVYEVQEGDTVASIAQTFGISVAELVRINGLRDDGLIVVGQALSVPVPEPSEQRVEDLRGYLAISTHKQSDGASTKQYNLEVLQETGGTSLYTMEGAILGELDSYHGLPILVTGTIDISGKLFVESYKLPYPDLQFQILRGTQSIEQLEGRPVTVFTSEDGTSYVEFYSTNNIPNEGSFTGNLGDLIEQEVLIIPGETFGGLPVIRIYQSAMIQQDGPAMEIQGNKIPVHDETIDPGVPGEFTQPNLTIDTVELIYFVSNPYIQMNDPNYSQRSPHIQPVWHFHGQYEDGTQFDSLIQALRQEYLLPELVPYSGPG